MVYKGIVTQELKEAYLKYLDRFNVGPDEYDEIYFDDMPHDKLLYLIEKALETDMEIPDYMDSIDEMKRNKWIYFRRKNVMYIIITVAVLAGIIHIWVNAPKYSRG